MSKTLIGLLCILAWVSYGSLAIDDIYKHTLGYLFEHGWLKRPQEPEKTAYRQFWDAKGQYFLFGYINYYWLILTMEQEHLINTLEAVLFVAGKPLKTKELAKLLEIDEPQVLQALETLAEQKKDDGVVLLNNNGEFQLASNTKYSTQVKNFLNAELRKN